jgi:hypothetical protein
VRKPVDISASDAILDTYLGNNMTSVPTLRDLITERILYAASEEELHRDFQVTEEGLKDLSDLDLFELYEHTMLLSEW